MRIWLSPHLDTVRFFGSNGVLIHEERSPRTLHPDSINLCGSASCHEYQWRGCTILHTSRTVFRPTLDSFLLASQVLAYAEKLEVPIDTLADFGAGTGVAGICLAKLLACRRLVLIDHCKAARDCCRQNVAASELCCDVVFYSDAKKAMDDLHVDLAISNPPYFRSPHASAAVAHAGAYGNAILPDWISQCVTCRTPFVFIFPSATADSEWLLSTSNNCKIRSLSSIQVINRHGLMHAAATQVAQIRSASWDWPEHAVEVFLVHT